MEDAGEQLTEKPWWQSRRNRWPVIYLAALVLGFLLGWFFDVEELWAFGLAIVLSLVIDWLWFRFFDPQYPEHDLGSRNSGHNYSGPPQVRVPSEAVKGFFAATGIIAAIVLLIWLL